jgi:hypothetical protein
MNPKLVASRRPRRAWLMAGLIIFLSSPQKTEGQGTAGLDTPIGRRPVQLWPASEGAGDQDATQPGTAIDLGGWSYRATKARSAKDGVPWQLLVTPTGRNAETWHKGRTGAAFPIAMAARRTDEDSRKAEETIPIIEMPQVVWQQRMAPDLQNVVGIHFHEYVSDDYARLLFTLHKVPPDNPDGSPPAPSSYEGQSGTRIEATLLSPVVWSLDQSIVVRGDPLRKDLAARRAEHEVGHSRISQQILPAVLSGPQDWNLQSCTGRRSQVEYYWRREQIGRSWHGYQRDVGKLLTLRTSIVVVPPTRWSMMLPIPPNRVTQKHIQDFNDSIVRLGGRLSGADQLAQKSFHAQHGEYENPGAR